MLVILFSILGKGGAGEPFEEVGEVRLGRKVELFGNGLKGKRRCEVEQLFDTGKERRLNDGLRCLVGNASCYLREVAWADPQLGSVEVDIVAMAA